MIIAALACGEPAFPTSTPQIFTATPKPVATVSSEMANPTQKPAEPTAKAAAKPSATVEPTATPEPTEPPPTETPTPKTYSLGDVVEQGGYFLQAVAVADPAAAGPMYQAESGKKLVAVEMVLGNTEGTAFTVNELDAVLVDADGFTYKPDLGGVDDELELIELNPGERVKGWVPFQIPNDAKLQSIKFEVSAFGETLQSGLTPSSTGQAQLPTRTPPKLAKLGDVVEQDGYSLSASQVEDPAKPGVFFTAKKGTRLVAVNAVIGNVSGAKITVNELDAVLVDTDGFLYKPALGAHSGELELMDINAGEKVKGWIPFQIPQKAKLEGLKFNVSGNITLDAGLTK